jgi:hypothetical protein
MKIYNLLISNGRNWTSSTLFIDEKKALDYVQNLEMGQHEIEGDSLKCLFHYTDKEVVTPPFHADGKRIYCSYAWTSFDKNPSLGGCTWRAIYEQEVQ